MATTETPTRRGVRWAFDVANSPFGGAAEPSTPETSTSSLAYVNSQIIAHGFARAPLDLSELGREEQNRVVKCVLGMLSQRVDDMQRAEDLSARLRTISYEHERVSNMLRAAKNEVLQAEREAEAAKTKANALAKDITSAQTSHNRTAAQLAQTTSANAALRAASAADLRKREQDVARLKERWQKLAGEQAKLGTVGSGMVCSNWAVAVNEQYVGVRGEGEEAAEGAMRDAIEARERLAEVNDEFREVLVKLVNVVGDGLREKEVPNIKLPTPAALFTPPAIEDDAGPALNAYRTLRDLIQQLASAGSTHSPDKEIAAREAERAKAEKHRLEIREWEDKVEKVEREVARLKGELAASNDFCEKSRVLIQQMVNDKKALEKDVEDRDSSEAATIAEQRQQLEDERAKFTDAAIRLARERSDFEVERLALAEEKREWATRQLEEDLPRVATSEPNPKRPVPVVVVVSDSGSSPVPMHVSQEPCLQPIVEDEEDLQSEPPRELELEPEPEPVERNGLAGQLRMALKAAKAAEAGERPKKRGKAAASTAAGKKEKEKEKSRVKVKEKSADKAKGKAKEKAGAGSEEKENLASGSGSGSGSESGSGTTSVNPFAPAPKIPSTPRSLHPAAQRARARNYAPAVPSPLSRIISLAVSPGEKEVEEVVQLPSKMTMTMTLRSSANGRGARSPQNKSPKSSGSRSPKSGLAVGKSPKTGQGGAGTETGGGGKSTKTSVQSDVQSPLQAGAGSGSVVVGSLAEKFAAAAAKDRSKGKSKGADAEEGEGESEADSAGKSNSATTERSRTEQEKEKEDGRDLDVIFAAPKAKEKTTAAGSSRAGKSRVPVAAGKPTRVPVVAKRALMTPRKAAVGGVRAKRSAWKG